MASEMETTTSFISWMTPMIPAISRAVTSVTLWMAPTV